MTDKETEWKYWRKYIHNKKNKIDSRKICIPVYRAPLLSNDSFSSETFDSEVEDTLECEDLDEQRAELTKGGKTNRNKRKKKEGQNEEDNEGVLKFILERIEQEMEEEKKRNALRMRNKARTEEEKKKEEEKEDDEHRKSRHILRTEKEKDQEKEEEKEDDEHRKSRHILNWFVKKLDSFQKYKMLSCKHCNVSFDCTSSFTIPIDTRALKYVSYETTSHMASVLNTLDTALFDQMVHEHKKSLTCWPFELVQFAVASIAHAFHAEHVLCGAVDTEMSSPELRMSLANKKGNQEGITDKGSSDIQIVVVIGYHQEHYALLEINPEKRRVVIWESVEYQKKSDAVQYWMECIVLILQRHFEHELEEDSGNVIPLGAKKKK
jgi:hypothetical protein